MGSTCFKCLMIILSHFHCLSSPCFKLSPSVGFMASIGTHFSFHLIHSPCDFVSFSHWKSDVKSHAGNVHRVALCLGGVTLIHGTVRWDVGFLFSSCPTPFYTQSSYLLLAGHVGPWETWATIYWTRDLPRRRHCSILTSTLPLIAKDLLYAINLCNRKGFWFLRVSPQIFQC